MFVLTEMHQQRRGKYQVPQIHLTTSTKVTMFGVGTSEVLMRVCPFTEGKLLLLVMGVTVLQVLVQFMLCQPAKWHVLASGTQ